MDGVIEFSVPGNPQALKRHRDFTLKKKDGSFIMKNGRPVRVHTDPSRSDKSDFLAKCMQHKPDVPLDEPLKVVLVFKFERPKSHYRTGKNASLLKDDAPDWHTKTPDADNLAKFVCDSLNGIFWRDDSCICNLIVAKQYRNVPCVEITIQSAV